MSLVDDGTIGVSIDQELIGARDLVEYGRASPVGLAAPRPDPTLQAGVKHAITYAITVLIVSCPCAIGLAVPTVIVIDSGIAAERGVIFKAADSIELACKTSHVVFDKTATRTQGKVTVAVEYIDNTSNSMSLVLGLIGSNKHPISTAVTAHLKAKDMTASTAIDTKLLTGKGVEGSTPDLILRAGNPRWLNQSSNLQVQSTLERGYTPFCVTINDTLAAVFGLEDSIRLDALETITKLQEPDISVHFLSGDDGGAVRSIARQLALLTPLDQSPSRKSPATIFIGDGTNDASALATSIIGPTQHPDDDQHREEAVRQIKFNFSWSFVYNLFAVLLGVGTFVDAGIPPEFAGLGELVRVLPVVFPAVLLRWARA
ncbi:hypothetical protein BDV38DRAFT_278646 [Aspergillus pseudotamarii]|uniref:E1-E2 ATPase-domain-containing protein n=1 Tax=Aspergillus pseudotamarii TaxID=132259 RepID=A0A5N6T6A4_ASPPS|nr:uncharacterized protein BDV38DRAFT_278646 [Aspergillus pseudotamarii]KAE8141863.1 hypothetical protein BDV38DRAFT_278646 [Aspergillus pseudotamarii]